MESLKWFKYEPKIWDDGRISIESHEVQGCFMACCRLYWGRSGKLDLDFMRAKIQNDSSIERLIDQGFIQITGKGVKIEWMDEEIKRARDRQNKAKKAISKRWENTNVKRENYKSNTNIKEKKRKEFNIINPEKLKNG